MQGAGIYVYFDAYALRRLRLRFLYLAGLYEAENEFEIAFVVLIFRLQSQNAGMALT